MNIISIQLVLVIFHFMAYNRSPIQDQERFEIVYNASLESLSDTEWLSKIKNEWHATGINLRILWHQTETDNNVFDWKLLDGALNNLKRQELDVYLRVVMGTDIPWWLIQSVGCDETVKSKFLTRDDVHMRAGGEYLYNHYYHKMVLNLAGNTSPKQLNSVYYMKRFYTNILNRVKKWGEENSYLGRIKLFVPVLSPDEESEYPSALYNCGNDRIEYELTGYSNNEIILFRKYLIDKYRNNIAALNENWGSSFSDFSLIDPGNQKEFDWHESKYDYKYQQGRIDFINFRTSMLKNFFDTLAEITHESNFKFGLQFGSVYDEAIYRRGFVDPTPLLENADHLIIGDVFEYRPNLGFVADYARSISTFWKNYKGRSLKFSTESNWPGYRNIKDNDLVEYWKEQVTEYYENGGSALFISHWDVSPLSFSAGDEVKNGSLAEAFKTKWAGTLKKLKNSNILEQEARTSAVNLSCELVYYYNNDRDFNYFHNRGIKVGKVKTSADAVDLVEFPLFRFVKPSFNVKSKSGVYSLDDCDLITNFMIGEYPEILDNYGTFYLTASSFYMTDGTKETMRKNNSVLFKESDGLKKISSVKSDE